MGDALSQDVVNYVHKYMAMNYLFGLKTVQIVEFMHHEV